MEYICNGIDKISDWEDGGTDSLAQPTDKYPHIIGNPVPLELK